MTAVADPDLEVRGGGGGGGRGVGGCLKKIAKATYQFASAMWASAFVQN